MAKPFVVVFSGYGLNCEEETLRAFEMAGARGKIIHINDVIAKPEVLEKAQIIAMPGGFSYGDDTGSGKAYGNRLRGHLRGTLQKFFDRDTLTIGICNGFQILTAAGFLPGALIANDPEADASHRNGSGSGRYLCRWVDLEVKNESPWLADIGRLSLPIAHGEGKFYAQEGTLGSLQRDTAIALTYSAGEMSTYFDLPGNPNGSLENIAGITARNGRIFGLMPHPERAVSFFQLPHWTYRREQYVREDRDIPQEGPGLQIFKNAVHYFV